VSAIDDNYVAPLLLMANSAIVSSSAHFRLMVGYSASSLSVANRNFISDVLNALNIDFEFREIVIDVESVYDSYLTEITYARMYFADELDSNFLWVDADIVLRAGWDEIFQIGLEKSDSFVLIASRDPITQNESELTGTHNAALKLAGSDYFNAGFIYVDVLAWRNFGFRDAWKGIQSNYIALGFQFQDQCVLNHLLFGYVLHVSNQFNQFVKEDLEIEYKSPKVLHFSGGDKPWSHSFSYLLLRTSISIRLFERMYIKNVFILHFSLLSSAPKLACKSWFLLRSLNQDMTLTRLLKNVFKRGRDFTFKKL